MSTTSSASSLSASVQSLKSSLQLLDSSISILDQGISDFPRLSTVLSSTRKRTSTVSSDANKLYALKPSYKPVDWVSGVVPLVVPVVGQRQEEGREEEGWKKERLGYAVERLQLQSQQRQRQLRMSVSYAGQDFQ
ncbi:hypothetical protein VE02_05040 [Pseudogymnoascus sp. 03VT05]|nr:hypothetical protein VE02_05040 [Pseudogymnoascus sp. 03VT05]